MTVKIGLESIDIQEKITVETLLDSSIIGLVLSSKFVRKQCLNWKNKKTYLYEECEQFFQ